MRNCELLSGKSGSGQVPSYWMRLFHLQAVSHYWLSVSCTVCSVGRLFPILNVDFLDELMNYSELFYYPCQEVLRSVVFVCWLVHSLVNIRRRNKLCASAQQTSGVAGARAKDIRTAQIYSEKVIQLAASTRRADDRSWLTGHSPWSSMGRHLVSRLSCGEFRRDLF